MERQNKVNIKVNLEPENAKETDTVYLVFNFEDKKLKLNLMSDNQIEMKNFFVSLLKNISNADCEFDFMNKNKDNLYNLAAEEYIDALNQDLITITNNYPTKRHSE